jgi:glutathione S-transferase
VSARSSAGTISSMQRRILMVLYTKLDCPLCNVAKIKLNATGIDYTISMNEEEMDKLNIDRVPVLQLDNGMLLEFKEILQYIEGGNLKNDN